MGADPSSFDFGFRIADCGLENKLSFNPHSEIRNPQWLNSAPLRRATAVVRDGRRVANGGDADARVVDGANGGFTPAARPLHTHLTLLHARFLSLVRRLVCR